MSSPMDIGRRAVEEARRWIGTPYVHQATCRGAGADCLGLVRGVWRALYGAEPCPIPAYSPDWAEVGCPDDLLTAARLHLREKPLAAVGCGDILLFRIRDRGAARHLGIQSVVGCEPRFIHAYSGHCVTESALSAPWARRICGRFAFPEGVV
jgi:NlpC/P60 family putative phage cell wall peptidase